MAYQATSKKSGKTYFLHQKGRMYYFAGVAGHNAIDALPDGYEVGENPKTGLPILRTKK
jgi:hypothetical protein